MADSDGEAGKQSRESVRDALVLDEFVRGLYPDRLRQQVQIAQPSNLDEALDHAQIIEGILSEQPGGIPGSSNAVCPRVFAAYPGERTQSQAMTGSTSQRESVVSWRSGKTDHMRRDCNTLDATESPQLSGKWTGVKLARASVTLFRQLNLNPPAQAAPKLTSSNLSPVSQPLETPSSSSAFNPLLDLVSASVPSPGCSVVDSARPCQEGESPTSLQMAQVVSERTGQGLTEPQQQELWRVLERLHAVFATSASEVGQTQWEQHCINTGNAPPIRQRVCRFPPTRQLAADCCLEEIKVFVRCDFNEGKLVWVHGPKQKKGRSPKLDCVWIGPCYVVKRLGETVYQVMEKPGGQAVVLHRDRLAPYQGDRQPFGSGSAHQTAGATRPTHGGAEHAAPGNGWGTPVGGKEGDSLIRTPGSALDTS
ncbi:hypothetical protein IRJ41_024219 [Triplophysa rosa]|uniref:Uncharacterized protein n=1 Tax=Triplophysa rosa TaxID=992332 RepID=A0A9W8CCA3_TRIRA|nr:hypothetical protein IRJ41_024219 [Triplophysa rosa]